MSMTKRYLESLPAKEQDDILGLAHDDEWTESAENEPLEECAVCGCGFSSEFEGTVCPDCIVVEGSEGDRDWAQTLTDETEDEQC